MENQHYLETAILGADRLELTRMLYRGAIAAAQQARGNLQRGEIMQRSKSISRSLDFISELTLSLNHDAPGGVSQRLAELYQYVQQLLLKAHATQSDSKLAEAISVLETLLSAWNELKASDVEAASGRSEGVGLAAAAISGPGEEADQNQQIPANPYSNSTPGQLGRSWDL
jgi:flagellar secretion chaperone FliS